MTRHIRLPSGRVINLDWIVLVDVTTCARTTIREGDEDFAAFLAVLESMPTRHPTHNVVDSEIARLRAELGRSQLEHRYALHVMGGMTEEIWNLRAALAAKTLRAETVEFVRMAIDTMRQVSDTDTDEEDEAMADLDRCYPPEEE